MSSLIRWISSIASLVADRCKRLVITLIHRDRYGVRLDRLGASAAQVLVIVLLLTCGQVGPHLFALYAAEQANPASVVPPAPAPSPAPGQHPATPPNAQSGDESPPTAPPALIALLARRAADKNAGFTSNTPIIRTFLGMGFRHIIPDGFEGWDHVLFMVGLFLLAPRLKPLLIQVTAFTVGHSITLGLCMAHIVELPARFVETTIAISIAFVAIENVCYRDIKPWRWIVVFCFGLVHGLGFAELLKTLVMPPGTFFPALISFNVGVELGQLTVICVAAFLTVWFWKKPWYRSRIIIPSSVIIACIGLVWAVTRVMA